MDDLASVALHLITKQHCLKINAELCNNLNILSLIKSIYYVSGDLSYSGGTIRIITTRCEHL